MFLKKGIKKIINLLKKESFAKKEYNIIISKELKLKGKTAIVTGGNGFIGRAICFRLASEGAKVYVSGRNENKILSIVNEIKEKELIAEPMIIDVSNADSIENAFNNISDNIDILVNCAGGGARDRMMSLDKQSIDVIDEILNVNLRGTILCSRKAIQNMISNKIKGKIVIISSAVGVQGLANYSEYGAAKAGDIGFMKSLALEVGKYGITVNCITPGKVERGNLSKDYIEFIKNTNALKSFCTMEDVANAVLFMVSDDAEFITGQSLCVDGGRTLGLMGENN